MNKKIFIRLLLVLFWLIIIFCFSNTPSKESNSKSVNLISNVIKISYKITNKEIDDNYVNKLATKYNYIVRKFIHFSEYFILTILIILALNLFRVYNKYLCAIIICLIFATWDEIHQLFIIGRSGQFIDILIDTSGGIMTCLIIFILHKFKNRRRFITK